MLALEEELNGRGLERLGLNAFSCKRTAVAL